MTKLMLIDAVHEEETRVIIADGDHIEDFDFVTTSKKQLKGNIYLAKVTRVEPSLQAAFVEYGGNKQGFLSFSEIHPDYYQIPVADKERLIAEEEAENEREEREEEEKLEARENKRNRRGRRRGRKPRKEKEETIDDAESTEESAAESEEKATDDATVMAADSAEMEVHSEPVEVEEEDSSEKTETKGSEEAPPGQEEEVATGEPHAHEEDEDDDVETVSGDETEESQQRRKGSSFKRYRIQEVIKRNQIMLVQVIKEERGNKGVSLSTYISLAGRYCVLMPNSPKGGGISRKITNSEHRKKLKTIAAEFKDKHGMSAIIRTAGIDRTRAEIKRDYDYLIKLWNQIREDTLQSTAPALIHEEGDIIKRAIRDMYTSDIENVFVQGEDAYKNAKSFMKLIMPSHAPRVKQHKEQAPIFTHYTIDEQLETMFQPEAKLPSGGSIVLHPTEALISIDVNSGRSTSARNIEETALKTNLEAAREIARQLRLRDLAGLIVIDFIDMYYGKNRRTVERAMKDALRSDRAKIQASRISIFGLMELSRQRMRPSVAEASSIRCPHCQGTGFIPSVQTIAMRIIRLLEREAVSGEWKTLRVGTTVEVAIHLLNERRAMIRQLEEQYDLQIEVIIEEDVSSGQYKLYKIDEEGKESLHKEGKDQRKKRSRKRRGGRDKYAKHANDNADEADEAEDTDVNEEEAEHPQEDKPKRGRRRARTKREEAEDADAVEDEETKKPAKKRGRKKKEETGKTSKSKKVEDDSDDTGNDAADDDGRQEAGESSTSIKNTASDIASEQSSIDITSDEDKPKRKGWWNRLA